jgi:hypothetical protein
VDQHQQREQHLKEHIKEDLELQKKLEDELRIAGDEKQKAKLKKDIKDIKGEITVRQNELNTIIAQRRESLAREMPSVTFDELEIVTKFILGMQPASTEINFTLTDITQKMLTNQLTQEVHFLLTMGMGKVKEVGRFVEHSAILRPDFPEKLKQGFLLSTKDYGTRSYRRCLFESLRQFSCGYSSDFRKEQQAWLFYPIFLRSARCSSDDSLYQPKFYL